MTKRFTKKRKAAASDLDPATKKRNDQLTERRKRALRKRRREKSHQ